MSPVRPSRVLLFFSGLALSGPAHALSCEEILSMLAVNVPEPIVLQTIEQTTRYFTAEDLTCLEREGAPTSVQDAVREALASSTETPAPPTPPDRAEEPHLLGEALLGAEPSNALRDQDDLRQVIRLIDARKPLTASLLLADLLEEDAHPERSSQLHYHLARSLEALELHHSARHHFEQVLRHGPSDPYFDHALRHVVLLAERSGDLSDLRRLVARLPRTNWPRRVEPVLAYAAGLHQLEQGQLAQALELLEEVPTDSPHGLQARYLEGIILNRKGRPKSAADTFLEVIRADAPLPSRAEAKQARDLKNLALLNVARVHYGLQLFERSEELYAQVEPESLHWPRARLEMAWAQFMQNDTSGSMGQLLTLRSPSFDEEPFLPEAQLLRALNHYTLCEFDEVERLTVGFEERYGPQQRELHAFAARYASAEGRKLADQAWATYFEGFPQGSTLDREIFSHLLRNRDLANQVMRLEALEHELELIGQQKTRWNEGMEPRLRPILEAERQRTRRRAGLLLLAETARLSVELEDLLDQSRLIRFESNDLQRADIEWLADNLGQGDLTLVVESRIPYATDPTRIYWPWNGEFWRDELGSYVVAGESACR